jgi:hypothetical protein
MKRSKSLIAKVSSQISCRLRPFGGRSGPMAPRRSSIDRATAYPEIWQLFALAASILTRHAQVIPVAPFYVET